MIQREPDPDGPAQEVSKHDNTMAAPAPEYQPLTEADHPRRSLVDVRAE
ncbi:MAG: hypothetical protein LBE08_09580 [Bifidobacteriaceae bacterium]|nr:hypothetical protein [Bifidobacteriaceae bacterium]